MSCYVEHRHISKTNQFSMHLVSIVCVLVCLFGAIQGHIAGLGDITSVFKDAPTAISTLTLKDSELAYIHPDGCILCGACREIVMSMHGSVSEADLSGETVEFGHRVQGAKSARKSIQYARSEAHITDLVSEFCASKHMDVKAFVAVGLRQDTKEWVFLTKTDLKDKETMKPIENTMNGTEVPKRLLKLCGSFMGEYEDEISEYLRRKNAKGEYRELPSPVTMARDLCTLRIKVCKSDGGQNLNAESKAQAKVEVIKPGNSKTEL